MQKSINILFIPDDLFQVYLLDLIDGMTKDEIHSFISLHIEENAPFPIDQLYWGHILSSTKILIYVAYKKAVQNITTTTHLDDYDYILPHLTGLLGRDFSESIIIQSENSKWNIKIEFSENEKLPSSISYQPIEKEFKLDKKLHKPQVEKVYSLEYVSKSLFQSRITQTDSSGTSRDIRFTSILTDKNIWDADIRPSNKKKKLQKNKKREHSLKRIATGFAITAFICCLTSITLFGLQELINIRKNKISEQEPSVQEVKENDSLADKLTAFSNRQMRPFSMLHMINEARPQTTYLKQSSCDSWNQLLLEGISANGSQFNQFLREIEKNSFVEKSQVIKQRTTQGKTLFTLKVFFNEVPSYKELDSSITTLMKENLNEIQD